MKCFWRHATAYAYTSIRHTYKRWMCTFTMQNDIPYESTHIERGERWMKRERERICEYLLFRTFTFIQFKLLDITWHYGSQSNQHHANAVQRYASLEFARAQPYTHVHLSEIFTCSMYKFCIFGAIIRFNQMNFRICERVCVWALGTQNALMYAD